MDLSILYAFGVIAIVVAVAVGVKYLKKNEYVDEQSIELAINVFDFLADVLDEMNLKQEAEIQKIAQVVNDALKYVQSVMGTDDKDALANATLVYAEELCKDLDIELNEKRIELMEKLIAVAVENIDKAVDSIS